MLGVWNMYNRVPVTAVSGDTTDSWNYTTKTWRAANAAVSSGILNRITVVNGFNDDAIEAVYHGLASGTNAQPVWFGVGLDSTSAVSGTAGLLIPSANGPASNDGAYRGAVGLGLHFFQAIEAATAVGTMTFYGDNADASFTQMGISINWRN